MAQHVPSTKEEKVTVLVQEMVRRGDEIPERFIQKEGFPEAIDVQDLWRDDLLIDFSLLSSETQLAKLRSALNQWGCVLVVNHGIENSLLEELIQVCKQFFELPLEEKLKCLYEDDVFEGYGTEAKYNTWNDRLSLTLYPEEKRKLQFWPTKPENSRKVMDEYSNKLTNISADIYKAMAKSLNIAEDSFLNHQGKKGGIVGRFSMYPRCPYPELIIGAKPHSDTSTMTIVLPGKDIDGLQVLKDDKWYKVPVIPGALLVNIGDLGEVISNGIFKSVVHRVVTSSVTERVSVIAFFYPEEEKEIGPLTELVSIDQPPLYKKATLHEIRQIANEIDEKTGFGNRKVDALKLY